MEFPTISELKKQVSVGDSSAWSLLEELAKTVQRVHYPGVQDSEDLISEAIVRGVDLILNSAENEVRSPRSYIYTRMRNTMSNMMYRRQHDACCSLEDQVSVEAKEAPDSRNIDVTPIVDSVFEELGKYRNLEGKTLNLVRQMINGQRIDQVEVEGREQERLLAICLWRVSDSLHQ